MRVDRAPGCPGDVIGVEDVRVLVRDELEVPVVVVAERREIVGRGHEEVNRVVGQRGRRAVGVVGVVGRGRSRSTPSAPSRERRTGARSRPRRSSPPSRRSARAPCSSGSESAASRSSTTSGTDRQRALLCRRRAGGHGARECQDDEARRGSRRRRRRTDLEHGVDGDDRTTRCDVVAGIGPTRGPGSQIVVEERLAVADVAVDELARLGRDLGELCAETRLRRTAPCEDESTVSRVHRTTAMASNSYPPGIETCSVIGLADPRDVVGRDEKSAVLDDVVAREAFVEIRRAVRAELGLDAQCPTRGRARRPARPRVGVLRPWGRMRERWQRKGAGRPLAGRAAVRAGPAQPGPARAAWGRACCTGAGATACCIGARSDLRSSRLRRWLSRGRRFRRGEAVHEPERSGHGLECGLHGRVLRGLLLQERQRAPDCVERRRAGRRACRATRSFDLEEGSHGVGNRFGDRHELRGHARIGLERRQGTSERFTGGSRGELPGRTWALQRGSSLSPSAHCDEGCESPPYQPKFRRSRRKEARRPCRPFGRPPCLPPRLPRPVRAHGETLPRPGPGGR